MTPDPYALSRLLRSTGKSAREIVAAYNAAHPLAPLSSPNVESWMRPPGASRKPTRPRWDVLAGLADALNIPRPTLYAACAGETGSTGLAPALAAIDAEIEGNDSVPVIRALWRVRARIAGLSDA